VRKIRSRPRRGPDRSPEYLAWIRTLGFRFVAGITGSIRIRIIGWASRVFCTGMQWTSKNSCFDCRVASGSKHPTLFILWRWDNRSAGPRPSGAASGWSYRAQLRPKAFGNYTYW